jgi:uncharacterized protein
MIFLDTSGAYALADRDDEMHETAVRMFDAARDNGEEIVTHNYVLVESAALMQRRLGVGVALAFLRDARDFATMWADEEMHDEAVKLMARRKLSALSLVDALSFLIMRDKRINEFLGFDRHFEDAGFQRYSG